MNARHLLAFTCIMHASLAACSQDGVVGSFKGAGTNPSATTVSTAKTAISAGGMSTCVRSAAGDVRCWGENETGSLGIGNQDPTKSDKPLEPYKLGLVTALFAGEQAHCAIRPDDKVYCWGTVPAEFPPPTGTSGPGFVTTVPTITPWEIGERTGPITSMAIGRDFACTLDVSGAVGCFGSNAKGQLGSGTTTASIEPVAVSGFDGAVTSIAASMGGVFACAVTQSGAVYCWGEGGNGQMGGTSIAPVLAPRAIEGLPAKAIDVALGGAHACALLADGRVACWGAGGEGQLGDGKGVTSTTPVIVEALTDVVSISAGRASTCAVRSEGSVFCWGKDAPDPKRPAMVLEPSYKARAVSCGLAHACAWGEGSRIACWGDDTKLQLGPKQATF